MKENDLLQGLDPERDRIEDEKQFAKILGEERKEKNYLIDMIANVEKYPDQYEARVEAGDMMGVFKKTGDTEERLCFMPRREYEKLTILARFKQAGNKVVKDAEQLYPKGMEKAEREPQH